MLKYLYTYNIVGNSPWPVLISFNVLSIMLTFVMWIYQACDNRFILLLIIIELTTLILSFFSWVNEISDERYHHNSILSDNLRLGFVLFVLTEVLLFLTFFLSYGYYILIVDYSAIGGIPIGINKLDAFGVPLFNTAILYVSGVTVTLSMLSLISKNYYNSVVLLVITIILGIVFTVLQVYEYYEAGFTISDSYYGSLFYLLTGFHGIHVVIGTLFLIYSLIRVISKSWYGDNITMFSNASLYWHFVDYVWLLLFVLVYLIQ